MLVYNISHIMPVRRLGRHRTDCPTPKHRTGRAIPKQ